MERGGGDGGGQGLGNQPPTLNATGTIEREAGSITVTPLFASAGPFPALGEAVRLPDAQINGVDQRNLTVGQSGDAAIVFGSEFASFVNTLGVFLIRPNGEMVDPKIVFPEIEQAERDPDFPILRPGGGPVAAGDAGPAQRSVRSGPAAAGTEIRSVPDRPRFHAQWRRSLGRPAFRQRWSHAADRGWPTDRGQRLLHHRSDTRLAERQSAEPRRARPRRLGSPARPCGAHDRIRGQAARRSWRQRLQRRDGRRRTQPDRSGGVYRRRGPRRPRCHDRRSRRRRLSAGASIELSGQPGDALAFDGSLAGTGVDLTTSTATSLVFEGVAPIADLRADPGERGAGARTGGRRAADRLTVVDERGRRERSLRAQRRSERDGRQDRHPGRRPARRPAAGRRRDRPALTATTSCSATPATTCWTAVRATTS